MKFLLTYHEDAKASMPTSTYSYLAQSGLYLKKKFDHSFCSICLFIGIPSFVEKLHIAAKKLPKCEIKLKIFQTRSFRSSICSL